MAPAPSSSQKTQSRTNFPPTYYPPLKIDPTREIRLVEIISKKGPIQCKLRTHTLDLNADGALAPIRRDEAHAFEEIPKERCYFALSYCWGGFQDHGAIQLEDVKQFPVSRNLYNALLRLRAHMKGEKVRLWIDQICINQHNTAERNAQVRIMGQVYNQAKGVFAWLGDSLPRGLTVNTDRLRRWGQSAKMLVTAPEAYLTYGREVMALSEVMSQQQSMWWSRAWVLQEWALARIDPRILYGAYEVENTDMLVAIVSQWSIDPETGELNNEHSESVGALIQARAFTYADQGSPHPPTLFNYKGFLTRCMCLDPRDKIYGLLAIVPGLADLIQPDYTKDPGVVYTEATCATIQQSGSLGILVIATTAPNLRDPDLPSWVVDFAFPSKSQKRMELFIAMGESLEPELAFWTSSRTRPTTDFQYGKPAILRLRALSFDTICRISPVDMDDRLPAAFLNDESTERLRAMFNKNTDPYRNLQTREQQIQVDDPSSDGATMDPDPEPVAMPLGIVDSVFAAWRNNISSESFGYSVLTASPKLCLTPTEGDEPYDWKDYIWENHLRFTSRGMTMIRTKAGFMGLGSTAVEPGDHVVLVDGSTIPIIIRQETNDKWIFVGFTLVYGIQDLYKPEFSEVLSLLRLEEATFTII